MNQKTLDKLHEEELKILDEVDRVCHELNICYYITAGTLLGAVRHGGFIPWDDDLDIVMPRDDYERFLKECNGVIDKKYYCQSRYNSDVFPNNFAKVRIKNTAFVEKGLEPIADRLDMGIYIDVFPLDSAKKENGIQKWQKFFIERATALYQIKIGLYDDASFLKKTLSKLFSKKALLKIRYNLAVKYNKESNRFYINLGSRYDIKKQTILKEKYGVPCRLRFENREYNAPQDYLYILEHIYGKSYMELPPIEKRRTHNPIKLSFDLNGPDEIVDDE